MTVIGITGTRKGANPEQLVQLRASIADMYRSTQGRIRLHHGDCIGVDDQAHHIALDLHIPIEVHPPNIKTFRAFTTGWDILHRERSYKGRNQDIVDACDILYAVPEGPESQFPRSGTWQTVRMARNSHKPVIIMKGGLW